MTTDEIMALAGAWANAGYLTKQEAADALCTAVAALAATRDALQRDNDNLRTVMIAAAEEISAHWDAHCDAEGYGPVNLQRRLEQGIPAEYGYTAGAFAELKAERDARRQAADKAERSSIRFANIIDRHCIAMQAAVIDERHMGAAAGMQWIRNTLIGPGLYPDISEAMALSEDNPAQAWFDAKVAESEAFRATHPGPDAPKGE